MSELISELRKNFQDPLQKMDQIIGNMKLERDRLKEEFEKRIEKLRFGQLDFSQLEDFLDEPYVVIPKRQNEWYVIAPKWIH